VHSHGSNCIYSVAKSNRDSIGFSLSITEQRAVGFILAWSLASLHISSIENEMGTLSSSPCQLRLRVDLSHLG